jgi:hypothetical protein
MLYCRDSGIFPIPGAVAGMSPCLDLTQSLPSWQLNCAYDYFRFKNGGENNANELVHDDDLCESYVSPVFATETDYKLSPIMLQIGEAEMYFYVYIGLETIVCTLLMCLRIQTLSSRCIKTNHTFSKLIVEFLKYPKLRSEG